MANVTVRLNLHRAAAINPDEAVRAQRASESTGLPVAVVERNLKEIEQREQARENEAILKYAPSLARQFQNPDFAKAASDDLGMLSAAERTAKALGGGAAQATLGISESVLRTPEAVGRVAEFASEAVEDFTGLPRNLNPVRGVQDVADFFAKGKLPGTSARMGGASDWANRVNKSQEALSTETGAFGETFKRLSEKGRAADAALSTAIKGDVRQLGQVLTDPEAWAGFLGQAVPSLYTAYKSGGSLPFMAWLEAMGTANDAAAFEARTGVHVDPQQYTQALAQVALLNSALEKFGLDKVLGVKGGGLAGTIKATLAEGGTEALQQLNSNVAQWAAYNPDQRLTQGVLGSAMGGAVSGGGTHGFVAAVNAGVTKNDKNRQAAAAALQDAQTLQTLSDTAAESKLHERAPAAFGQFVEAAVSESGSPVTDIYVRAVDFSNALAQAGIEPAAVVQMAPSLAGQMVEAIETNGDLRIPIGEYAAAIAGTDANAALLPHLRTSPEAMSQAEAVLWQEQAGAEFQAEAERIVAGHPEGQEPTPVQDSVLGQLRRAGRFTDDVNTAYAGLVGTFYAAMSERVGTTPEALFQEFPLHVLAESPAGPQTLGQSVVAQVGRVFRTILGQSTGSTPEGQAPAGARGSYSIPDHTIALLRNADLSTFIHESGHFFLEALADIAARPTAPQELKDDMATVLQWFGVPDLATWQGMTLEEKRAHHEQFARGFEAYAFEGNAPTIEMQSVFARFRAWMLAVYRSMTALNVELSDEVRGVFNRMLATKDQISATEAARSYRPLFDNAADLYMTADQWADYQKLGSGATAEAVASLERRSLRDMQWLANAKGRKLRELQGAAADKRTALEAEVQAEVRADPVYAAIRFLTRGELAEGDRTNAQRRVEEQAGMLGSKLSLPVLKEMYGEGPAAPWRYLVTGQYGMVTAEDGLHPDMAAELLGFTSGDELVRKILAADPESAVVEGITDQRMLERYGDLSSPEALERAAEAAIHNDARARFLEREVNLLAKAVGNWPVLLKAARAFAEDSTARKKVRDLRPSQYSVAEGRAAREATQAFKKGDTATAAAAKRAQLLNNQLQRAAGNAVEEIEKGVRYLRQAGDSATIDPEYREQIVALLDRFDLRKISNIEALRRESLLEWIEAQRELGHEPVISADLLNEAQRQPYREMTVEAFRGLVDAVKNIEHLGRLKHKLLTAADERAFGVRVDEAVRSIEDNAKRTLPVKLESNRWADKVKDGVSQFFALHRKFASLMREMDGFKDAGALWDLFVRPMNKAGDTEAVMREQATVRLSELFKPILAAGKLRQKVFIPEINASLSREGRLMVALNTGNEGNMQRLMGGDKWTPAQVRAITDTLTKEEWDFVQSVWDFIGTYREEVGAQQKRLTGIEPEWIEATPVRTKFGVYGGGYFPAKYDTNRSTRSLADEASQNIMDMWRGKRGLAKARDSFTKGRAEKVINRPLRKDFGVVFQHVTALLSG